MDLKLYFSILLFPRCPIHLKLETHVVVINILFYIFLDISISYLFNLIQLFESTLFSRALFSAPLFYLLTCHFLKICFNLNAHFGENLEVNKADDVSAY